MTAMAIQVLQSLVVVVFAPLYAGVITRAEAVVGSKRGPSVLQPYRDLAKLRPAQSMASRTVNSQGSRRTSGPASGGPGGYAPGRTRLTLPGRAA